MVDHPMSMRLLLEQTDGLQLARPDIELEIASEILPRDVGGPAERTRVSLDDLFDVSEAISLGSFESLVQISTFDPRADHPGGKDKRKAGQLFPGLAQVQLMMKILRLFADDFVANEQASGARCGGRIR